MTSRAGSRLRRQPDLERAGMAGGHRLAGLQHMPLPANLARRILFSLRPLSSAARISQRKMSTAPSFVQEPHK